MDVLTSETCWALNKVIIKQVASSWSLFTQTLSCQDGTDCRPLQVFPPHTRNSNRCCRQEGNAPMLCGKACPCARHKACWGGYRYSSIHSFFRHWLEVREQLHAPSVLLPASCSGSVALVRPQKAFCLSSLIESFWLLAEWGCAVRLLTETNPNL